MLVASLGMPAPGLGGEYTSPGTPEAILSDGRVLFSAGVSTDGDVLFMGEGLKGVSS